MGHGLGAIVYWAMGWGLWAGGYSEGGWEKSVLVHHSPH